MITDTVYGQVIKMYMSIFLSSTIVLKKANIICVSFLISNVQDEHMTNV